MAGINLFEKYGIKEVADMTLYEINQDGSPGKPVLYLESLKISTINQAAENVEARGGKGNTSWVSWDHNKEIDLEVQDALFSMKSMAILFGDGTIDEDTKSLKKTFSFTAPNVPTTWKGPTGIDYTIPTTAVITDATGATVEKDSLSAGLIYLITFDVPIVGKEVVLTTNSFPGTYYVTGDTYSRSAITGKDEFFQFIVPKAKVLAENSLTLEADGEPSVFNMNMKAMRAENNVLMRLIQYDIDGNPTAG